MHRHVSNAMTRFAAALRAMSPLGQCTAAFGIVCLLAVPFTGWQEALAAGVMLSSLLVLAVVASRDVACGTVSLDVSACRVSVGDAVDVNVTVTNTSAATVPGCRALVPVGAELRRIVLPRIDVGGEDHVRMAIDARSRGVMNVGPVVVHTGDPLGLMRRERRVAEPRAVTVHPRIVGFSMPAFGITHDLDGAPSMRVVDDDLNFHGLREYRPGDDLRGVHWLSTARTGRLMVRQYEASHRIDVGLDLDAVESDYADHDEFELAVSVFASIGAQCLLACRPLSACVGGERIRPRNAMEFLDFCSAIVPRRTVEPSHAAPSGNGHAATDARNNHVLRCSVIGSRHTARNGNAFPAVSTNIPHIVLRTAQPHGDDAHGRSDGERPAPITTQGPVTARIDTLDALPSIMEGWS